MSTTLPPTKTGESTKPIHDRAKPTESKPKSESSKISRPTPSEQKYPNGINWVTVAWIGFIHVAALAAPWTFTWSALAITVFMHWVTGSIGVCMGYHRYFTHSGFKTSRPVSWILAITGGLSGEGSVLDWVATHREHHAFSDLDGDPHSPHDGAWWSHLWWLARAKTPTELQEHRKRWAPDLLKDKSLVLIHWAFLPSHFIFGAMLYGVGYAVGGHVLGLSWLIWGLFLRLVLVMHTTWFVNSASHMFGYRNYETTDDSRNNWWVAIIAYGEGWHNNHHAYPRMAVHGHKWWEFDITYMAIRLMKSVGMVWDVVDYRDAKEKASS